MKFTFMIFLSTLLTIVQSQRRSLIIDAKSRLPSLNPKKYLSYLDPSKLDFSYLNLPDLKLPNITIGKLEFFHDFPSISEIGNKVEEISPAAFEKIKRQLTDFYEQQIKMFKNVTLMLFDDDEHPVKLDFQTNKGRSVKLPDFNLLHPFPDLNKEVTIKLFTKESGDKFDVLGINNETALKKSHFNTNRHTYILTHGFMATSDGPSCTLIQHALLNTTNCNVITVNWSPLSKGSYAVARLFVPFVGAHIGKLINFLYENRLRPERTTLIGHSLGAHVMGVAGQTANKKVNHTIGLDPAWPLFVSVPENQRLSPNDALHVEVIHTNGGLLGFPFNLGHFDFYPNGGFFQKGCKNEIFTACSHGRSYRYLAEQIVNPSPTFCSIKCKSYSEFKKKNCTKEIAFMGGVSYFPANGGEYYLETNDKEPFSLSIECSV